MKSTIKKLPESKIELEIEVPFEEFNNFIDKATLNLGKDLEVEGFRKGKAPKEIIEEKVGKENILVEAADLAVKENYRKVVLENKVEVISQPKIDILKLPRPTSPSAQSRASGGASANPFIFKAKISVLPEIELPDYKEIAQKTKKREALVDEKEIENALSWLQKSRAKFTLKNETAQKGDFIEIEYWSSQMKELNQKEVKKDAFILGEGHFIDGFEEKLLGMKTNEEKEFSLTLPEISPSKNLAGKEIDFKVKVISVQNVELPIVNDEFAKSLGKFENLEALKEDIKKGLNLEKEQAEAQRVKSEILKEIAGATKCEIPEVLIEREQKAMMENFKQEVSEKLNISLEDYLIKIKKTEKEVFDSFLPEAQKRVKVFLVLREIGQEEKIEVSDEEVKEEADKMLKHYPNIEQAEKDLDLDLEKLKVYAKEVIKNEKIFKLLENLTTSI